MLLALITSTLMTFGLIAHQRAVLMAGGTLPGTIAFAEAERAAGFSALLCILTAPWLILAAVLLRI
jgi:hypothetical protein